MVRLAENAGYGFDRIETNWKIYNNTEPEYDISFDATILKLNTKQQEKNVKTSETYNKDFIEASESLQNELNKNPADIEAVMNILSDNYEGFLQFISENFENPSERLQRDFRETSETLRRDFGDKAVALLLLIVFDKNITVKNAAKIIGVSDRSINTYLAKLKSENIIERVGPDFGGYWTLNTNKPK
jgi:predicted HTH transcriptional regulator